MPSVPNPSGPPASILYTARMRRVEARSTRSLSPLLSLTDQQGCASPSLAAVLPSPPLPSAASPPQPRPLTRLARRAAASPSAPPTDAQRSDAASPAPAVSVVVSGFASPSPAQWLGAIPSLPSPGGATVSEVVDLRVARRRLGNARRQRDEALNDEADRAAAASTVHPQPTQPSPPTHSSYAHRHAEPAPHAHAPVPSAFGAEVRCVCLLCRCAGSAQPQASASGVPD